VRQSGALAGVGHGRRMTRRWTPRARGRNPLRRREQTRCDGLSRP
jgi:hypothetical protein